MGYAEQFQWKSSVEVFTEMAILTPSYAGLTYERLNKSEAFNCPCPTTEHPGTSILHGERYGIPDGKRIKSGISFKYQTERLDIVFTFLLTTGRCI
jgi:formate dehydrogenase (coenzyme F420) alpha subunit